ncbi:MAG: polyprenyl synthetase family protein [Fibrobacterota bacterium]
MDFTNEELRRLRDCVQKQRNTYAQHLKNKTSPDFLTQEYAAVLSSYIQNPGKQFRSLFFLLTYFSLSEKHPEGIYASALAVDLMQDFILIHDDLIDGAHTRRGELTVDKKIARRNTKSRINPRHAALIMGDYLYASSLDMFLEINAPSDTKERALKKITQAAMKTARGQLKEFSLQEKSWSGITANMIYDVYDLKTGYYSFCAPMTAGATLAGRDEKFCRGLEKAGLLLSRAFQLCDDYNDLVSPAHLTGKSGIPDLHRGVKTIPLLYVYQNLSDPEKTHFEKSPWTAHTKIQSTLKTWISSPALSEFIEKEKERCISTAFSILTKLLPENRETQALFYICNQIFTPEKTL